MRAKKKEKKQNLSKNGTHSSIRMAEKAVLLAIKHANKNIAKRGKEREANYGTFYPLKWNKVAANLLGKITVNFK